MAKYWKHYILSQNDTIEARFLAIMKNQTAFAGKSEESLNLSAKTACVLFMLIQFNPTLFPEKCVEKIKSCDSRMQSIQSTFDQITIGCKSANENVHFRLDILKYIRNYLDKLSSENIKTSLKEFDLDVTDEDISQLKKVVKTGIDYLTKLKQIKTYPSAADFGKTVASATLTGTVIGGGVGMLALIGTGYGVVPGLIVGAGIGAIIGAIVGMITFLVKHFIVNPAQVYWLDRKYANSSLSFWQTPKEPLEKAIKQVATTNVHLEKNKEDKENKPATSQPRYA